MNRKNDLVKPIFLNFNPNMRILVLSDPHGNYHLVNELLKRNNYNEKNDYLIILGDLAAKGPYPLKTLRYFMNLSHHKNVYIIMGNCDESDFLVMEEENISYFEMYLTANSSLIKDMYNELSTKTNLFNKSIIELQKIIKDAYHKEFTFIKNLSHLIITEQYIFTHARVPEKIDLENDSYKLYVGGRRFYLDGHQNDQTVVAGHMPVNIFKTNENNDNILFLKDKKMILIDGGMIVRNGGQINLLMIDLLNHQAKQLDYITGLPKKIVTENQTNYITEKGTSWPFYKIKILEKGEFFSKCLIEETLEIAHIKNEYITIDDKSTIGETSTIDNCPSNLIDVKIGDIIEIIDETPKGYALVKKNGTLGWLNKKCIGEIQND